MDQKIGIEPRIYVACLAAYNAGKLHGKWIELEGKSAAEVREEIQGILKASPEPHAEEWAIHDFELGGIKIGESEDIEKLMELVGHLVEHGEAFAAYVNNQGVAYANLEGFEDAYQGEHDSIEDYAEQWLEDTGSLAQIPENLRFYFDYAKYARDLELGGDIWSSESDHGTVYVFYNN